MTEAHHHKPGHDAACTFVVRGMDCFEEVGLLKKRLGRMPGVCCIEANLVAQQARIVHDRSLTGTRQIQSAIAETGLEALPVGAAPKRDVSRVFSTAAGGALTAIAYTISRLGFDQPAIAVYALAILFAGLPVAIRGLKALRAGTADMNVLMTLAVTGAAALGDWPEAATVAFLFSLANLLESYSADKARNAIRSLMQSVPRTALAKREDGLVEVPVESLEPGDIIVIRPGERVPLDGRVSAGHSAVNQAPLTGEPVPVEKSQSDEVWAGSVNGRGSLEVEVTRPVEDSTIARITRMVEEAQSHRAPVQKFADRFAAIYTPTVMGLAALVMVVPALAFKQPFADWFYRGLVLLVIACPCALVISTPVTIVSALATAARAGVLIKGGLYLEQLGSLKAIALDKTGTLTRGVPEISTILTLDEESEDRILTLAAAVARRSEHPLAQAVFDRAEQRGVQLPEASAFHSLPGLGATAEVEGERYYLGSARFFRESGRLDEDAEEAVQWLEGSGATVVVFGTEERALAAMGVSDRERPGAADAIAELRSLVGMTVMLTGDGYRTATAVALRLGVTEWRSDLLPEDKLKAVRELVERHGKVAMVGDGVNDAPALAAATVGIAMGAAGTDVALETADVALMGDELGHLPFAIRLSRRAMGIVWFNVVFALAIKIGFLAVAVAGLATLWMAVVADMGASLFVILNALRLLRVRA